MDAPPFSYLMNIGVADEVGVDAEDVRGVLMAVAPIVGTARVASATGHIVRALGIALEMAELEEAQVVRWRSSRKLRSSRKGTDPGGCAGNVHCVHPAPSARACRPSRERGAPRDAGFPAASAFLAMSR